MTTNFKEITYLPPAKQENKISLNIQQVVTPPPAPKPMPMPKPIITPPIQKPIIEKKVVTPEPVQEEVKRVLIDESKKTFAVKSTEENNVTKVAKKPAKKEIKKKIVEKKVTKKPTKKVVKKKITPQKRVVQKKVVQRKPVRRQPKRSNDPLANMLMGSGTSLVPQARQRSNAGTYGEQMIKQLYGSEFNTFTTTQKEFIRNNLSTIHRITQGTLTRNGYPTVAIQTGQQGTNVVTFNLHPNGDISGLRLKTAIGYSALDDNTIKVIQLAYKDYPLPNQKTKITFYVIYSMN